MIYRFVRRCLMFFSLALMAMVRMPSAHAERLGVVVYDSLASNDPRTILGHAAAYLPHICTGENNFQFRTCNPGEQGVVLNRSEGVTDTLSLDWIAVPLSINVYGMTDVKQPPLMLTKPIATKLACDYYRQSGLAQFLNPTDATLPTEKRLDPSQQIKGCENIPGGNWASMAKTSFDSSIVVTVDMSEIIGKQVAEEMHSDLNEEAVVAETKVREDAAWGRVIQYLNQHAMDTQKYRAIKANCAHWAHEILQVALNDFKGNAKLEDFFVESPLAVASGVREIAAGYHVPYQVARINQVASDVPHSFLPSNPIDSLTSPRSWLTLPVQVVTAGLGTPFLALSMLRQLVPGFKIPFFVRPRFLVTSEVKKHADEILENASADLKYDKLNRAEKINAKAILKARQDTLFGKPECWKEAAIGVQSIAEWAFQHQYLTHDEYSELRKSKWVTKTLSHVIPFDPDHPGAQNTDLVKAFTSRATFETSHDEQNGTTLIMTTTDGKKVGLSPTNVDQYDLILGLKALLISMYFDLDQDAINHPTSLDFDAKLKALESVVLKLGAGPDPFPVASGITYCSSVLED